MNDRSAFMQAIIAAPDDDVPRLIFADWLEEHGETERAEFIRVQIAIANGEAYMGGGPEFSYLRSRELELFSEHGRDWFFEVFERFPDTWGLPWVRRGFVEKEKV